MKALATCMSSPRAKITPQALGALTAPVMVAVGTKDDIAGDPHELAALLPNGQALPIPNRDHMVAVGDKVFKEAVIVFLAELDGDRG